MKLIQMVVDDRFRLVGFMVEGTGKEFGNLTKEKKTAPLSLKHLIGNNFNNKQIVVNNGIIHEKPGFHINNLPMLMLQDGNFTPINNTIEIIKRYVQNNENIGFGVLIGGVKEAKYNYENTIKMCNLFKPINFIVRTGSNNKRFIVGKSGSSLNSIPAQVLGEPSKAKRVKSTTKENDGGITGEFTHEVDILDLYDFIRTVDGYIINLPNTKYVPTTQSNPTAKEFIPFNIGEIGVPYLDFNETKFNVSCNFKKPGAVALELRKGSMTNVITFAYRRKNIFFDGDNYIDKLGVIVPDKADSELIARFGKSMSFTPITDTAVTSQLSMLIAQQNVKFYEVDTSKIGIISKQNLDKYIMTTQDVYKRVLQLSKNKLISKYLRALIKECNAAEKIEYPNKSKEIAPQFAAMNEEELELLKKNGIDIYSGAFTVKDTTKKSDGKATETVTEVGYMIAGLNVNNITYKQMLENSDKLPFLKEIIDEFNGITSISDRAIEAQNRLNKQEKKAEVLKRELWLHKCAMYLKSNKSSVHSHDKENWELNTKKRTKARCYDCKQEGCEKLQLLLSNIDIG